MRKNLHVLLLQAAILAAPPLGQQTRLAPVPGYARRAAPAPRRRTASDYLALAAAEARRIQREARNLRNREGFSHG